MSGIPYQSMADIYDTLMLDAPYPLWVEKVLRLAHDHLPQNPKILDLACGSGRVLVQLAKMGFDVTGVDQSSEMLAIARWRMEEEKIPPFPLYEQDMRELSLGTSFDLIYSFLDSICYLTREEEWRALFQRVYHHLNPGGLFYFDIHSLFKIGRWGECPIVQDDEEISYIWIPEVIGEGHVIHRLSFFRLERDGRYKRIDEEHEERTFPIDQVAHWLRRVGFHLLSVTGDFTEDLPTESSERLFFLAKRG